MRERSFIVLAVGMAVMVWAATSEAGPRWGRGMGPGPYLCDHSHLSSFLGLTQEQEAQLSSLREKHFNELAPLRQQLFTKRQELRLLWADPAADQEKIIAKQKEIEQLTSQMQELHLKHWLEIRGLLTPEQIQKLSVMRGPGLMGGFGGRWGCGPWGW